MSIWLILLIVCGIVTLLGIIVAILSYSDDAKNKKNRWQHLVLFICWGICCTYPHRLCFVEANMADP